MLFEWSMYGCGWVLLFLHSNFALYVYEKKTLTFPLMKYVRGWVLCVLPFELKYEDEFMC
jgi:hypothetical protein